jgi:hypothetical protein
MTPMPGKNADLLVIGGGASGLFAAVHAARRGLKTVVLESGPAVGRKILASGNGRCNLTNVNAAPDRYCGDRAFVAEVLRGFSGRDAISFFKSLGVMMVEEEGGRIFPRTDKSSAVLTPLSLAAAQAGVEILTGSKVRHIAKNNGGYSVATENGNSHGAKNILLACGSPAAPGLGGSASGFELAKSLGHVITPYAPALVPLCIKEKGAARLAGTRARARLRGLKGETEICASRGEILFTPYGLSGPAALNISGPCALVLRDGRAFCELDLFPELAEDEFALFFKARLEALGGRPWKHFLSGMLPENTANLLMDMAGIDKNAVAREAGRNSMQTFTRLCRAWRLEIASTRPIAEAMTVAGGVNTGQVNAATMESRNSKGLYFAGEILEPAGESGGFNLQFAWASGFIAGNSCKA